MNESIKRRAAAIRNYISKSDHLSPDPNDLHKFSVALATWDALRLKIDKGPATVEDDQRLAELTDLCQVLSEKVGMGRRLTMVGGFLKGDPSRIICKTWQEAAEGW